MIKVIMKRPETRTAAMPSMASEKVSFGLGCFFSVFLKSILSCKEAGFNVQDETCGPTAQIATDGPAVVLNGRVYHCRHSRRFFVPRAVTNKSIGDARQCSHAAQIPNSGCPGYGRDCRPLRNIHQPVPAALHLACAFVVRYATSDLPGL